MRAKLTVTRVKSLTKPGRHSDGDGLYLLIKPDGRKSWTFMWTRGGKRREMGLGSLTGIAPVSLALAREKADHVRAILARGGDPFADMPERRQRALRTTFAQARDALLATMTFRNAKHRAQWEMTTGPTYCESIVDKPVASVDTEAVVKILEPIWQVKPETASRLRGRIERVLDFARVEGWRDGENPARWKGHLEHRLGKQDVAVKHHAAMPVADVPGFVAKLRGMDSMGAKALQFSILTAARSGEVRGATWDEITGDVWEIPAERMKAKRPHRVPLTSESLAVVAWARERSTGDLVFPGARAGKPLSDMTLAKVLKDAELPYTPHGFRSTFRDWCGDHTEFARETVEEALAHLVGNEVERAYRRSDSLAKRRQLMTAWADFLTGEKASAAESEAAS